MVLTITHLYPDKMNLYGDLGNVIALKQRAEARGIQVTISNVSIGDEIKRGATDIYFFGGGQDKEQIEIYQDLLDKKAYKLYQDLEEGVVMLAICGGYQLLGKYFITGDGKKVEGLGFLPIETVAPSTNVKQRCIGNISTTITHRQILKEIQKYYSFEKSSDIPTTDYRLLITTLVGFENHGGRTRLLSKKPLQIGKVINGIGDSENQGYEGLRYKNTFGSYMHGSFLPKNPHFADLLLSLALKRKYGPKFKKLEPLDDSVEWAAHEKALALN